MRILLAILALTACAATPAAAAVVYAEQLFVTEIVAKPSGYHWIFLTGFDPVTGAATPFTFPAATVGCTDHSRGVIIESPAYPGGGRTLDQAGLALVDPSFGVSPYRRGVAISYDTTCVEWEPGSGVFAPQIRSLYR